MGERQSLNGHLLQVNRAGAGIAALTAGIRTQLVNNSPQIGL
jgi:hypothetical protein